MPPKTTTPDLKFTPADIDLIIAVFAQPIEINKKNLQDALGLPNAGHCTTRLNRFKEKLAKFKGTPGGSKPIDKGEDDGTGKEVTEQKAAPKKSAKRKLDKNEAADTGVPKPKRVQKTKFAKQVAKENVEMKEAIHDDNLQDLDAEGESDDLLGPPLEKYPGPHGQQYAW